MNAERWRGIEELYDQARACSGTEREDLLERAGQEDPELRREVEELLAHSDPSAEWKPMEAMLPQSTIIHAGQMFGAYEVREHIGAGGMGSVWKAIDRRLNRTVAIKVSKAQFSDRFEREARAVAALNHPNIGALYDVGADPSGVGFLVLEFVEGITLADRIRRGPILPAEAIPIALQIAEAIELAHERGIVHRDLKPENIKLRPDGVVKVLDFGLAKALELENDDNRDRQPSTSKVIAGTPAYMAPEQIVGKKTDRRSDIWSFGVVLYEMLTGVRLFAGETTGATLESVIKDHPKLDRAPQQWRALIERCVTKDPRQRLQSIGEARIALEAAENVDTRPSARAITQSGRRWPWIVVTLAAVSLLISAVIAFYLRNAARGDVSDEARVEITTPPTNDPRSFALSPNGKWIAYVANGVDGQTELWVRPMSSTTAQALAAVSGGAAYPFWSPDNHSIGFFSDGKLKRVDITGGPPQIVADALSGRGGSWNANGEIVYAPSAASTIVKVSAAGGTPVAVTKLDGSGSHRFPQFLPDNQHFLFYAEGIQNQLRNNLVGSVMIGSLDSTDAKPVTTSDSAGLFIPSGWLLFVRAGTLVAQRLDIARTQLSGNPITVADSVFFDSSHARLFTVSSNGLIAYRRGAPNLKLIWYDRSGKILGSINPPIDSTGYAPDNPSISPDGKAVVVHRRVHDQTDLWLISGTAATRLTFSGGVGGIWSGDGRRIAYQDGLPDGAAQQRFLLKSTDGTSDQQPVWELPSKQPMEDWLEAIARDWSQDGRFLLYETLTTKTGRDMWVIPLKGDRKPALFLQTPFDEKLGRFSPDGRWVAYVSNETGTPEVYIRTFFDPSSPNARLEAGAEWQISRGGGTFPTWSHDNKEIYFVSPGGHMMAAPITHEGKALHPGNPVELFQVRINGGGLDINTGGRQFDVASDGRFLINTIQDSADAFITLLQNWKPQ